MSRPCVCADRRVEDPAHEAVLLVQGAGRRELEGVEQQGAGLVDDSLLRSEVDPLALGLRKARKYARPHPGLQLCELWRYRFPWGDLLSLIQWP